MESGYERIVEGLVDLKDTSELMLDLAYSAILLRSEDLAEEVDRLEDYIDVVHEQFQLMVLSCDLVNGDPQARLSLIDMGEFAETIADAARDIADVVLGGREPHPVLRMVIDESDETATRLEISPDSPVVGKSLREARIPEQTGMWVVVIRRGDKVLRPSGSTVLEAKDVIIASGYEEGEQDFRNLIAGKSLKRHR